jgi:hypothetical protein
MADGASWLLATSSPAAELTIGAHPLSATTRGPAVTGRASVFAILGRWGCAPLPGPWLSTHSREKLVGPMPCFPTLEDLTKCRSFCQLLPGPLPY